MKLVKRLKSKTENATVEVTIEINTTNGLVADEARELIADATDKVMQSMCDFKYAGNYLHRIKVS